VKGLLRKARAAVDSRRQAGSEGRLGTLSVVVDATDEQAPFLDECLARLLGHKIGLQVLVALHGPFTEVREVAGRHAAADGRVVVLPGSAADRAAARTAGVAAADGDLLAFVTASDVVPTGGYGALVRALATSGSDVAVGGLVVRRGPASASRLAVEAPLLGVTVADVPEALTDATLGNRVFRRAFWDELGVGLDEAAGVHDVLPALRATLRARSLDVLPDVAYQRHDRALRAPIGTIRPVMPALDAWLRQVGEVDAEVPDSLRGPWLRALLDTGVQAFLADAEAADAWQWRALTVATAGWVEAITATAPEQWALVTAEHRVRAWLTAQDRRADLEQFVAARWYENRHLPTRVEDGPDGASVLAVLPLVDDGSVPRELYVMAGAELPLVASLRDLRWTGPARCTAEVFAFVRYLDLGAEVPSLTATLVHEGTGARRSLPVESSPGRVQSALRPDVTAWANDRYQRYDGCAFDLDLDLSGLEPGAWSLELTWSARGVTRTSGLTHLFARGPVPRTTVRDDGGTTVRVECTGSDPLRVHVGGRAKPPKAPAGPLVDGVDADVEAVRFRVLGLDKLDQREGLDRRFTLTAGRTVLEASAVESDGDHHLVTFGTRRPWWGREDVLLPSGDYTLRLDGTPVAAAPEAFATCGRDEVNALFRWGLRRDGQERVLLAVSPPLYDEHLGAHAQERLLVEAREAGLPIDHGAAYFQSYDGKVAGDSQRALHEELRRRGSDLTLYWGVHDLATVLPEGAVPLVIGSPEWHRTLATARYLCSNVDFERRFHKREGQLFLETFHGYPSKAMGIGLWQAKGYSPLRIEAERRRTCADWDLIITPTPEMDAHYREQYAYDGPIFDQGLPRNDALRAADRDEVRARARALLGIRDDQVAVLYAPTWRDDVASGYESAPATTHLDAARAAGALGDGYVLLMRGHRFQAAVDPTGHGATVLDVSDHPDVNELVLASDAGVFDYSSLRFDFALTGRPMLFLVPDLELYTGGGRGFLFDYTESAPGPLLEDTDQVVAALRDLDAVRRQHDEAYAEFDRRFNGHHDGHAAARLVDRFYADRFDAGGRGARDGD